MTTIAKPGFWNLLPVQSLDWRLSVQQEFSGLAGGDVLRADVGASLWTADVGLAPMTPATAATIRTLLMQLERPGVSFLAYDLASQYPAAGGGSGAQGTVDSVDLAASEIRVAGLPAGYEITAGDYVEIQYGANPLRYGLHRYTASVTANSNGTAALAGVVPAPRAGIVAGSLVDFARPACKAVLVPGTVDFGRMQRGLIRGARFSLRQTLR